MQQSLRSGPRPTSAAGVSNGRASGRHHWRLGLLLLLLLSSQLSWAQVTKTLPGDYASFAAAFTDLNTNGVPAGGVTINVTPGYAETLAAPLLLTATGTAANPIVFQKSGSGANPKITAGVGTTTGLDAIIGLAGSDFVTFDGLELAENAANTTPTQQMEFGFAMFRPSPTDGCQSNVIRNCVVTLNKANTGTFGIYGAATTATATTSVAATSPAGANSNNRIYGNTVSNAVSGMYLTGNSSTAIANYDQNNEIGVTAGNNVSNFGGLATSGWGIGVNMQNGAKIANNIVNSTGGTAGTSTLRGIYGNSGTSSNIDITNNTITLVSGATTSTTTGIDNGIGSTAASNTVNITGNTVQLNSSTVTTGATVGIANTTSAATVNLTGNTVGGSLTASTTAAFTGISNSGSATTANLTGNTVTGCSLPTATTGIFTGVVNSGAGTTVNLNNNIVTNNTAFGTGSMLLVSGGSPATLNMNGNTVTGNSKTPTAPSSSTTMQGLTAGTTAVTATNNTVSNNTVTISGTSTSAGIIYGYYQNSSPTSETLTSNTFTNLAVSGTSTSTGHIVAGIRSFPEATTVHGITLNTIATLSVSGSGSGTVSGMLLFSGGGTASNYARNKIYDLSAVGASGSVAGINISGGTTFPVNNNLIGDLRAPASTSLIAVNGIQIGAATAANVYYNTIYLAATSSGATFGTSGLYLSSTTPTVDVRNNIVVNKSTAAGTAGFTAALRRTSATFTGYATTSNNNLYYAGTPSATQVLYYNGTTGYPTIGAFKTAVAPRESNSVTEDVSFLSTSGSSASFLHINPAVPTQVEGNATPVASVTLDFDGQTRNATTPDIGADEGTFTPQDLTGPAIVYTALGNTNSTANRTLTATITDASGIGTGANAPRLYYRKGSSGAFVFVTPTSVSGNDYTFTFDFALLGGVAGFDVIQYYVAAQDNAPAQNVNSTPIGASGNNPPGTAFTGTPNQFTIQGALSGTYYVGTSTSPDPARTYASLTAAISAYTNNNLGGAVTFLLLDPTYSAATGETFPLVINGHADASATNTLTIKPNTGVTPTISGSVVTGAVLKLNGADYVTIDGANSAGGTTQNLTIENVSATGAGNAVLWLAAASATDGATFNTVKNSVIRGTSATGTPQFTVFLGGGGVGVTAPTTSTPAANSNNTISNNQILKGYYGLFIFGTSATVLDQNNVVSGNQLGLGTGNGFGQEGIRAVYQQNLLVEGNEVQNLANATTTSNLYGIFLADSRGTTLSRNSVHNIAYTGTSTTKVWGIFTSNTAFTTAATPSATLLTNNLVYSLTSTATSSTWNTVGINNGGGYGDKYYFNTVYLSGQLSAASGTAGSAAFANGNPSVTTFATNIDVRNNIFSIIGGTGGTTTTPLYAHYTLATTYTGSILDNNDLYVATGSTGTARIGRLNAVDAVDLAAWRTATGQEANSVSVDPTFTQVTTVPYNLKPSNIALNSAGATGTGITVDYLNATRSNPPDIGALEFSPPPFDLAPAALVSPASGGSCYSAAETVVVSVRNQGSSPLDFSANAATITAVVTVPGGGTQTLTASLASGTLAVGAAQNVTLSPTLDMTAFGTYSFAITATVAGDGNTGNDVLTPAPTRTVVAPVAGTLNASSGTICISGTTNLTLAGSANGGIQLQQSTDNVTFTDIAGATSATYTTPVLTGTTYFRARISCGTNVATSNVVTVTVNNPQITSTNTPVAICEGGTATLTATANAGTTIRFYDAATGGNLLATAGTFTTPALTASQQYFVEASTGAVSVAGLTSNAASNGTFTQSTLTDYPLGFAVTQAGTLTTVDVYPTAAGPLTIRLYSVAGTQPGGAVTAVAGSDVTITVTAAQVGTKVTIPVNYALTPGDYKLSNFAGTLGRFSTYTGTYPLTSADGVLTVKGSYTLFSSTSYANTTYNSFFNLTFSNLCVASARTPIQVNVSALPTASLASATGQICAGTTYQLAGTVGGSATSGTFTSSGTGSFLPNATTLNATYSPSAADISAGSVVITLTTSGPAACTAATAATTLTINPAAVATLTPSGPTTFCQGGSVTLSVPAVTGSTYQFLLNGSPISGATTDSYLASTSGNYSVEVTTALGCTATSAVTTVTVNPVTTATFSYPATTFCQNVTNPTATIMGTTGGTFSSTAGLSLNATTGAINLAASTPGTYTVTYSVGGPCSSSATASVTVNPATSAAFAYAGSTFCLSGTNPTATVTGTAGGTFSSTSGLSLNATTGTISLTGSTPGTYTVTYSVGGPCPSSSTALVTITTAPSASFAYAQPSYCAGSTATATPTFGTNSSGGVFTVSPATGLTINSNTGVIDLSTSVAGTYTVTNSISAAGGCAAATATTTVTINAAPVATLTAGGPTTFCQGGSVILTAPAGTGNTYQFLRNGAPISGATAATYSAISAGNYAVVVTNASGCSATSAVTTITVNPTTTATFSYSAAAFCLSGTNPTPTVTGTTGGTFSSTTGLTLDPATGVINLTASTAGTYTVTYTVGGPCPSTGTATVVLNPNAVANAGAARTVCSGNATQLGAAAVTGYTYSWSPATGLSSSTVANPTLTLTNTGAAPLVATYTLTATTANGCSSTATVQVTVNPAPAATLTAGGATTFCQGGSVTLTANATTGNTYQYFLNGTAIVGATNATFVAAASGSYTVQLTNATGCFTVSTPVVVTVNPTPATPTLTSTTQPSGAVLLTSSAATGNQFYRNNVLIPGATGQTYLLLSGAQSGTYTVVSTSTSGCASVASNALVITVTASAKANLAAVSALLFPNPTTDGNVTVELRGYSKAAEVMVLNTLGQVVRTFALHPEKAAGSASATPVDFSELPVGVYMLRISSPNTATQVVKMVRR